MKTNTPSTSGTPGRSGASRVAALPPSISGQPGRSSRYEKPDRFCLRSGSRLNRFPSTKPLRLWSFPLEKWFVLWEIERNFGLSSFRSRPGGNAPGGFILVFQPAALPSRRFCSAGYSQSGGAFFVEAAAGTGSLNPRGPTRPIPRSPVPTGPAAMLATIVLPPTHCRPATSPPDPVHRFRSRPPCINPAVPCPSGRRDRHSRAGEKLSRGERPGGPGEWCLRSDPRAQPRR